MGIKLKFSSLALWREKLLYKKLNLLMKLFWLFESFTSLIPWIVSKSNIFNSSSLILDLFDKDRVLLLMYFRKLNIKKDIKIIDTNEYFGDKFIRVIIGSIKVDKYPITKGICLIIPLLQNIKWLENKLFW